MKQKIVARRALRTRRRSAILLGSALLLFAGGTSTPAWSENPAPSVHWGSTAFPDQYTTVTSGLTLNRFTPVDGIGNKYDSTVGNTLGFNLMTLSWTQHWTGMLEGWSTNLTAGVSPTSDEPSQYFQNKVVHQLRQLPSVPTVDPRKETDVTIDGSITRWISLSDQKVLFAGGGFSVGTIYQQGFLRGGIRRLQITPSVWHSEKWGDINVRASAMGRVSYQSNGAALHSVRSTAGLVQPAIAIGQYRTTASGETIPTWEIELALMWDSGIFVNTMGQSQKQFAWSLAASAGPVRFETWNDSMGHFSERDYGPSYGAALTIDVLRMLSVIREFQAAPVMGPSASS
ncbi:MAG TPA: hypothetical protein PLO50_04765 [Nitrospira sp.]|nr:hypothetical protein [Nitrospira sp.]